jgi:hypothetical protein
MSRDKISATHEILAHRNNVGFPKKTRRVKDDWIDDLFYFWILLKILIIFIDLSRKRKKFRYISRKFWENVPNKKILEKTEIL